MSADILLNALGQLPAWQSDLARRLATKPHLDDQDVGEIEANVLASGPLPHGRRIRREDLPDDARVSGSPRLLGIRDVHDVGCLRPGAAITFARSGLTVAYGDNGAGKTSFVRTLKESCRAVDGGDPILSNVFANAGGESRYGLDVEVDGAPLPIDRRVGMSAEPRLGSVSIFDSSCAELYVSKALGLAYVPQPLQLLERVARELQALRETWKARGVELQGQRPRFDELPHGTRARAAMDSALPSVSEIESLAPLTRSELERLAELERLLANATAVEAERRALLDRRERMARMRANAERLLEASSDEAIGEWRRLERESARLAADVEAFARSLERLLPGVGTPAWRTMMSAADAYRAEHLTAQHDDQCALCQQTLDSTARGRMRQLAAIAEGELEQQRAAVASMAEATRSSLEQAGLEARRLAEHLVGQEPETRLVRDLAERVAQRLADVLSGKGPSEDVISRPDTELGRVADSIDERLVELEQFDDASARELLLSEAKELGARRALGERLEEARQYAELAAETARYGKLFDKSKTNRLTGVTKKVTNELLSGRLGNSLGEALRDLGIRHLPVELKPSAAKGEPRVQLVMKTRSRARIDTVFSGGEQTSLALACFLAEVAASEHDGTIVLDDPVSSLDADRRRNVAYRLVQESRRRQVIVFTHDPSFYMLLQREAERAGRAPMAHRTITNLDGSAGHVVCEPPRVVANARQLGKELRRMLVELRTVSSDPRDYRLGVEAFGVRLRQAWERLTVEVLGGVVEPGCFEVRTRHLGKVIKDDRLAGLIYRGMGSASFGVHDQGTTMPKRAPTVAELEDELGLFQEARDLLDELRAEAKLGSAAE